VFRWDTTDIGKTGQSVKMRLHFTVITNATAPAANFSLALYPVTASGGGAAAQVFATTGAAVTGSTVSVTAPALSTVNVIESADFDAPATGQYVIMMTLSANMAANSSAAVRGIVKARAL
jgi:hypothetical protein